MTKGVYERCGPEQLQSRRRLLERLQRETWGVKLAVTQDIIKRSLAIGPPALLYSGGRDSTVLLHLVAGFLTQKPHQKPAGQNQTAPKLIVMHNNTTLGRPGALDWARSFVDKTSKAAKPAEITYIETTVDEDPIAMWDRTGYYPVLSKRGFTKYKRAIPGLRVSPVQCCYQLKEKYANAVLRTFRIRVVFWGNRADESQRRTFGMLDNGMLFKPKKYRWYQSYPLAHWTDADIDSYLKGNNIEYPPAASLETGCLPCCTDITMLPNNSSRLFSQDRPTWERYMRAGIGAHRVMCGDATSADHMEKLMGGKKAEIVFTDPPYGVSYDSKAGHGIIKNDGKRDDDLFKMLTAALTLAGSVTTDTAAFYIWHASATRREFEDAIMAAGLLEKQYIIWAKPSFVLGRAHYHWQHEPCFYCEKAGQSAEWLGDRSQGTIWHVTARSESGDRMGSVWLMVFE